MTPTSMRFRPKAWGPLAAVAAMLSAIVLSGCGTQAPDTFPQIQGKTLAQARTDIASWCPAATVVPARDALPPGIDESVIVVKSFVYSPKVRPHDQAGQNTVQTCPDGRVPVVTLTLATTVPDLNSVTLAEAQSILAARGITFQSTATGIDGPQSPVLSQDLPANQEIPLASFPSTKSVTVTPGILVPNLVNLPAGQVCRLLKTRQLGCVMPLNYNIDQASNLVTKQDPPAKQVVAAGSPVAVEIIEPPTVDTPVPNVLSLSNDDACTKLSAAGLSCGIVSGPPTGIVVDQIPDSGQLVAPQSLVSLVLRAPARLVPNVVGMSEADACKALADAGFACTAVKVKQGTQQGVVVAQDPGPGRAGGAVNQVTLSVADLLVTVPDVRGQQRDQACGQLSAQNLVCGYPTDATGGIVSAQNPVPGTQVLPGTLVSVTVPTKTTVPPWAYAAAGLLVVVAGAETIRRIRKRRHATPNSVQVLLAPGLPDVPSDRIREW